MNDEIILDTKLVGDIKGDFYVPSYQRGYRWSTTEVVRLLDDIYSTEGKRNYCLQPVVVRKKGDRYELIDGQQRITMIYLIYRFMNEESFGFIDEPRFTLSYETREKSEDFLKSIDESRKEENIDFWFLCSAYGNIKKWFSEKDRKSTLTNVNKYFDEIVKIIWYEVGESEDAIGLFTRLNIGKIPLTNAELIKAMFLSKDAEEDVDKEKQEEISLQWDNMEKELHNNSLWHFLTNKTNVAYQTRIELILDLISDKPSDNREKYYTFFKFDEMRRTEQLDDIWRSIQRTFLVLKNWYENHELYHKIGYLIASDTLTLQKIFELSRNITKDEFRNLLNDFIRESIKIKGNYSDLSYEKLQDQKKITALLLLFNVESVRRNGEHSQWFPFDKHKFGKEGKVTWSLEHIHAQQSEGLRTQEMWKEWLVLHLPSVKMINNDCDELIEGINSAIAKDRLERQEFDAIQQKVVNLLSVKGNTEYLHSIANMTLLSTSDNAALNNSTFDVKRNEIIKMDKAGQYIPFCTRMVFLKYYTPSIDNQLHFLGACRQDCVCRRNKYCIGGLSGRANRSGKRGKIIWLQHVTLLWIFLIQHLRMVRKRYS